MATNQNELSEREGQPESPARAPNPTAPGQPQQNGVNPPSFQFELHSPDFHMPADLAQNIRAKLSHRLHKYGRRIFGVVVHLRDVNGPRGGEGLLCHVEVRIPHLAPVVVEERDQDLRAAVDRAVDRMAVAVARHVDKAFYEPIEEARRQVRNGGAKLIG
jgi:ribosome-associated translation inhibitor RaiA